MNEQELKCLLEAQQQLLTGIFQTLGMIVKCQEKHSNATAELIAMQIKFMASYEIDRKRTFIHPDQNICPQ